MYSVALLSDIPVQSLVCSVRQLLKPSARLQQCVLDLGHVCLASFLLSTFVPADGPAAYPIPVQNIKPLLTVSFTSGDISLMNNYDDLSPTVIRSGLKGTEGCT